MRRLHNPDGAIVIHQRVIGEGIDPELLKWRLGMVFACLVEFLLITVAVRYLGPLAYRNLGTGAPVVWLAHHFYLAVAAWLAFVAATWWAMQFRNCERVVTLGAVVVHLLALALVLGTIIAPR